MSAESYPSVRPHTVRGEDENLVLDRAGLEQHAPVLDPLSGPRRAHHHVLHALVQEATEQLREAEVVTRGQSQRSPWGGDGDDVLSGPHQGRLALAETEPVDLSVLRLRTVGSAENCGVIENPLGCA